MESPVPKFTSFKPPPRQDQSKDKPQARSNDHETSSRRHPHEHHRHHQPKTSLPKAKRNANPLGLDNVPTGESTNSRTYPHAKNAQPEPHNWKVDVKGDTGILLLGRTERSKVPRYRALIGRSIGKTTPDTEDWRSLRNLSRRDIEALSKQGRYLGSDTYSTSAGRECDTPPWQESDFVPLSLLGKRKRRTEAHVGAESDSGTVSPSDSGHEYESDAPLDQYHDDTNRDGLRFQHSALQERTCHQPKDVAAWLELVSFQEQWVESGFEDGGKASTRTELHSRQQTTSKLKLDILEKAIKTVPSTDSRYEELLLAAVSEYAVILDPTQYQEQWKKLVQRNPATHRLRAKYLEHVMCECGSKFKLEHCQQEYLAYIADLSRTDYSPTLFRQLAEAISDLTILFLQTGFSEQAIALWQAILETRFFKPSHLDVGCRDEKHLQAYAEAFEEFWEAESPRIGEHTASGWKNPLQHPPPTGPHDQSQGQESQDSNDLSKWNTQEATKSWNHCMPGRVMDDEDDDPMHVVLFSDLEPYLRLLLVPFEPRTILNAFLRFCNLPRLSNSMKEQTAVASKMYLLPCSSAATSCDHMSQDGSDFHTLQTTTRTLFCADSTPFRQFQNVSGSLSPLQLFAYNVLELLVQTNAEDLELVEYCIAYGAAVCPQRARKLAKSILKSQPSQLRVYNCLALLESRNGKHEDAQRIAATAFEMGRKIPGERVALDRLLLKQTWVWDALRKKHEVSALLRLMADTIQKPDSKDLPDLSAIETEERNLTIHVQKATETGTNDHIAASLDCLALLSYLRPFAQENTTPPTRPALDRAFQVYHEYLSSETAALLSTAIESVHQSCAQLIYHHIMTYGRAFTPAFLKTLIHHLRAAVAAFPRNTSFRAVLHAVVPRTDRIRAMLPSSGGDATESKTLQAWSSTIMQEIQRGVSLGGTQVAVRTQFERAVASDEGRHCPALWAWWLRWETGIAGDAQRAAAEMQGSGRKRLEARARALKPARDVWLKGYQALPWMKAWLELGLQLVGDAFTEDEIRGFYDGMVDRGLRFRVDLHEVLARRE